MYLYRHTDTGNACRHPGYEEFSPDSIPGECAPLVSDWVHLDPPPCGEGFPYPEEFWNCADISITAGEQQRRRLQRKGACSGYDVDMLQTLVTAWVHRLFLRTLLTRGGLYYLTPKTVF